YDLAGTVNGTGAHFTATIKISKGYIDFDDQRGFSTYGEKEEAETAVYTNRGTVL
ncbi:unnamed protein product, partial [Didymodactylos carnosus]